jgi:hypothetical protein
VAQNHFDRHSSKTPGAPKLTTSTVDVLTAQFSRLHPFQTVHVDRSDRRSIRHFSIGKALDAAGATEKVPDRFLVEEILGEIILAGRQPKVLSRRKRQHEPHALAPRAIAGDRIVEIDADLVLNGPALAAAFVLCNRH